MGICGLMFMPLVSHGEAVTLVNSEEPEQQGGSAILIDDSTVLFTIDFSFTDELFEVEVPIVAEYGVSYLDRVDTVGYTIENEDGEASVGSVMAIVLSRSTIDGARYSLPAGTEGKFTLMILATFEEKVSDGTHAYITKLPYWLNERRTTVHQNELDELDKPELEVTE